MKRIVKVKYKDLFGAILCHTVDMTTEEVNVFIDPVYEALSKARSRAIEETNDKDTIDEWYLNWWFGNRLYHEKNEELKELYSQIWKSVSNEISKAKT